MSAPAIRIAEVIRGLMARGFDDVAGSVVQAITNSGNSGIIAQRLRELAIEAEALAEAGKVLQVDNAVMRALLADMDDVIVNNRALIQAAGGQLQDDVFSLTHGSSAQVINRQLPLFGLSEADQTIIAAQWTMVDPEVMRELVGYVDQPAWEAQLAGYGDEIVAKIKRQITNGQIAGWGPVRMANEITKIIQGAPGGSNFPQSQGENMMRTLQMQSFRTAQTINRIANADILAAQIRIAALDDRTCLSCISLHGEPFPIDERIDDHHRGRCTSIPVVNGRPITVQTGQQWWDSRSEAQRLAQAGPANHNALKNGAVTLSDYQRPYDDPVFGSMIREESLKNILGEGAKRFYTHG